MCVSSEALSCIFPWPDMFYTDTILNGRPNSRTERTNKQKNKMNNNRMDASIFSLPNSRSYCFGRIQLKIELRRTVNTSPREENTIEMKTMRTKRACIEHWNIGTLNIGLLVGQSVVRVFVCVCVCVRVCISQCCRLSEFDKSQSTPTCCYSSKVTHFTAHSSHAWENIHALCAKALFTERVPYTQLQIST